jgi:hypothetical protein
MNNSVSHNPKVSARWHVPGRNQSIQTLLSKKTTQNKVLSQRSQWEPEQSTLVDNDSRITPLMTQRQAEEKLSSQRKKRLKKLKFQNIP